jgi:hypothetical protein
VTIPKRVYAPALTLAVALGAIGLVAADEMPVIVSGAVTVNGKPLASAGIVFHLDDGEFVGCRISGGRYKLTRVPAGQWRVSITSDAVDIPAKYGSEHTALRAAVQQGMNTLDFDLKIK